MDNIEIDRKTLVAQTIAELRGLPARILHLVLIQYALELTISARMQFVDEMYQSARDCNETLHRIMGFLRNELGSAPRGAKDSMIQMVVEGAEHKHRLLILRSALEQVLLTEKSPSN